MRYALAIILCALLLALSQGSANVPEPRAVLSWDPDEIIENLNTAPGDTVFLYVKLLDVPDIESISFETAWTPWDYPRGCYRMITSAPSGSCAWNEGYGTEEIGSEAPATRTLHFTYPPRDGSCIRLVFTAQGKRDDLRATFCLRNFKITDISGNESFLLTPNKATILNGVDLQLPQYVSGVDPKAVDTGIRTRLSIHGGHFTEPAIAKLTNPRTSSSHDLEILSVTPSRLDCIIMSALPDTGYWSIVVSNAGGFESILTDCIHIQAGSSYSPRDYGYVAGEVLVKLKRGHLTLPNDMTRIASNEALIADDALGATLTAFPVDSIFRVFPRFKPSDTLKVTRTGETVRLIDMSNIFRLTTYDSSSAKSLVAALSRLNGVVYAELNPLRYFDTVVPNDTLFVQQWALRNMGQFYGIPGIDMGVTQAWDYTTGSSDVKIGIIDTGVDADNIEFGLRVTGTGYDVYPPSHDYYGHGTAVAGIVGALGDNVAFIAGLNWHAQLHSEGLFPGGGAGGQVAQRIDSCVNEGCQIINLSVSDDTYNSTEHIAAMNAFNQNVFLAASMGNYDRRQVRYPAGYERSVVGVGALNNAGRRACWGPGLCSTYGPNIDFAAPGKNNWSVHPGDIAYLFNGTSAAAPHVSGVASLLLSYRPDLYNEDIEALLRMTAYDIWDYYDETTGPGWDEGTGYGLVRAVEPFRMLTPEWELLHPVISGSVHSTTNSSWYFEYIDGLGSGPYLAIRYDIRASVQLPEGYILGPYSWARCVGSRGYDSGSSGTVNGGVNYAEIIEDDGESITLRTFVYYILGAGGMHWFPCEPQDARMAYSILGMTETTSGIGLGDPGSGCHVLTCYPNPLRNVTTVSFYISQSGKVTVSVFDVAGRKVRSLLDEHCKRGVNHVRWDGNDSSGNTLPAGVYMISVEANGSKASSKIAVAR